jgi:hypothetical protein
VKCRRVEIRSVGPYKRMNLRVECDPVEQSQIPQRAIQFSPQNRFKIDDLFRGVVKEDTQGVRSDGTAAKAALK